MLLSEILKHRRSVGKSQERIARMRFHCDRDSLAEALGVTSRVGGARGSGIRLSLSGGRLEVVGSDPEMWLQTGLDVAGEEDGTCWVWGRLLNDVVRSLAPGRVSVGVQREVVEVEGGRSRFELPLLPGIEVTEGSEAGGDSFDVGAGLLADGLRQVVKAASSDLERPSLTGVLMELVGERLRLVATDSYRLALREIRIDGLSGLGMSEGRVLVPARALQELQRLLVGYSDDDVVRVVVGETNASFSFRGAKLVSRMLRAEFPNYEPLVPKDYPALLELEREGLTEALRRTKLILRDNTAAVRLVISGDVVELRAQAQDTGTYVEELEAKYEGENLTLGFNPSFLLDGVEGVLEEMVVMWMLDPKKPVLICGKENLEYKYVLMPVKIG